MKTALLFLSLCASLAAIAAEPSLDLCGLALNGAMTTTVERRVFDDGEAARYVLADGPRHISGEETVWTLPEDATVWYSLEDSCYEGLWIENVVREIPVGTRIGLPITAKLKDGTYRFISEANVVDYTDSSVVYRGEGRFAIRYYADEKGFDQEGVAHTPWRVLGSFKDLDALATSDIIRRLCPEPAPDVAARAAEFVKPGRCIWHWLPDGAPKFDMPVVAHALEHNVAFTRGPVLLARDSRFADGDLTEPFRRGIKDGQTMPTFAAVRTPSDDFWMSFSATLPIGSHHENPEGANPSTVFFCDYASAGNTWHRNNYYRTWFPIEWGPTE